MINLIPEQKKLDLLRSMHRIRMVEESIAKRYPEQEMRCPVHLSIGQEAAAVGVCETLQSDDLIFSGHRNHAHYLAKGGDLNRMLAELYGKSSGCCEGKGGSMHLTDSQCGFVAATPIVGSTVPIAAGAAFALKYEGYARVVVIFLGDGAMETGVVHETLNFASLKKLPILFVCENNLYSVYSPLNVRQPDNRSLADLASANGLETLKVDGNDVEDIYIKTLQAVDNLRKGSNSIFLELPTYRWREHCGPNFDNDIGYRTIDEFNEWVDRDPIQLLERRIGYSLSKESFDLIQNEISSAFKNAVSAPFPDKSTSELNIYSKKNILDESNSNHVLEKHQKRMRMSYAEALHDAQNFCLNAYEETYLMGLGVPDPKGVFGSTLNLHKAHGLNRVFDIPLSENAITGVAIGSAISGLRPILTHQRLDFALVSIEQIVNQAAKWSYMFDGTYEVPLVIRMIIGRGWGQGPQHSQSLHAWFGHIPGLKVIMPTTPYDAKGMLISAIEDNNPVISLEHRWLYEIKDSVPISPYRVPLDKAKIMKVGIDITIVGISYMTLECLKAEQILSKYDVDAEIIDLRSIRPIDYKTIVHSVEKSNHLLVVDHADPFCSVASEIISFVCENNFSDLHCSPSKLTLPPHPVPTSHALSDNYYPTYQEIVKEALSILSIEEKDQEYNDLNIRKDQPNQTFQGPF